MTQRRIRGDKIKKGLDTFDVLGPALKEALIDYVEKQGNKLDSKHYYHLKKIEVDIADVFGEDAERLVIKRVRRVIEVSADANPPAGNN